jgi:hypothetical protein
VFPPGAAAAEVVSDAIDAAKPRRVADLVIDGRAGAE